MKKVAIILAVLAVMLMVTQAGMAADKDKGKQHKRPDGIRGKVVSVEGGKLTITPFVRGQKKGDPKPEDVVVDTDDETAVSIDRERGKKVGDLKKGFFVFITPKEGTAKAIHALSKRPERGGKGGRGGKKGPKKPE